jgi:hypothetical protein
MCTDKPDPNCPCQKKKMIRPTNFKQGGMVKPKHKNIPSKMLPKGDVDTAYARLQVGEIVIPKKHTKKVAKFLKDNKIKLPGM